MKTKLECVAMKHQGAEKVHGKISGLSIVEELAFWQERSKKLRRQKKRAMKKCGSFEAKA